MLYTKLCRKELCLHPLLFPHYLFSYKQLRLVSLVSNSFEIVDLKNSTFLLSRCLGTQTRKLEFDITRYKICLPPYQVLQYKRKCTELESEAESLSYTGSGPKSIEPSRYVPRTSSERPSVSSGFDPR